MFEESLDDDPVDTFDAYKRREFPVSEEHPYGVWTISVLFEYYRLYQLANRATYGIRTSPAEYTYEDWYVEDSDSESDDIDSVEYSDSSEDEDDYRVLCQ